MLQIPHGEPGHCDLASVKGTYMTPNCFSFVTLPSLSLSTCQIFLSCVKNKSELYGPPVLHLGHSLSVTRWIFYRDEQSPWPGKLFDKRVWDRLGSGADMDG